MPGCRFNPPRASIIWLKDWHRIEFEVQPDPEQSDYAEEQAVNGTIAFYVGPVLVGEARIWAYITEHPDDLQTDTVNKSLAAGPVSKDICVVLAPGRKNCGRFGGSVQGFEAISTFETCARLEAARRGTLRY